MMPAGRGSPGTRRSANGFFAGPLREYVLQGPGRPVSLLQAGCLAPLGELGIGELAEAVSTSRSPPSTPVTR
jgi:hypothetical protein